MDEVRLPIVGYEGYYEVSNLGGIKSLERNVGGARGCPRILYKRVLRPRKDRQGYLIATLSKYGNQKKFKLHRLVANLFVRNENGME